MPRAPLAIAIDVGGTSAKLALIGGQGRMFRMISLPTGRHVGIRPLVEALARHVKVLRLDAMAAPGRLIGLGVGVPGLVDARRGVVRYLVNIRGWRDVPLRRLLERATKLPVVVDNDVNVMTWGEFRWGAGRGCQSLVCVMLGTGVGGGIVLNGHLHRGWTFSAGEIGHTPLTWDGPACPCGGRGCLERYIGNREIVALARRRLAGGRASLLRRLTGGDLRRISPPLITQAALAGDGVSREVWQQVGRHLGLTLTTVVNFLNPERIVIGGGIAKAGPLLFPTIRATVRGRAMRGPSATKIVPARFGAQAGLVGAAAMVLAPETSGGSR